MRYPRTTKCLIMILNDFCSITHLVAQQSFTAGNCWDLGLKSSSTASAPAIDAYSYESVMPERATEVRREVNFQICCSSLPCWFLSEHLGFLGWLRAGVYLLRPTWNLKRQQLYLQGILPRLISRPPLLPQRRRQFLQTAGKSKPGCMTCWGNAEHRKEHADFRQQKAELVLGA